MLINDIPSMLKTQQGKFQREKQTEQHQDLPEQQEPSRLVSIDSLTPSLQLSSVSSSTSKIEFPESETFLAGEYSCKSVKECDENGNDGFGHDVLSEEERRKRESLKRSIQIWQQAVAYSKRQAIHNASLMTSTSNISQLTQEDDQPTDDEEDDDCKTVATASTTQTELHEWTDRRKDKRESQRRTHIINTFRERLSPDQIVNSFIIRRHVKKTQRLHSWVHSLQKLDPRNQILLYYEEVARLGGPLKDPLAPPPDLDLLRGFSKAAAFTVWRPTSSEAIRKMMRGDATGKGLDIKGKSAKKGLLSGYIPFVQIHDNGDKKKVERPPEDATLRVFYKSLELRDEAQKFLEETYEEMKQKKLEAQNALAKLMNDKADISEQAEKQDIISDMHVQGDLPVWPIDDCNCGMGLTVSERVFFEAYISRQDISRDHTEYETGRPSEPAFQDMTLATMRKKYKGEGPRAVVYQTSESDATLPHSLVVAYEENKSVTPVVSDFDCFLLGTRGVVYDKPLPADQICLMKTVVKEIEKILETPGDKCWSSRWLEVLRTYATNGHKKPSVPKYGYGDPKSYDIVAGAVSRFAHNKNGAVRHGPECFNYYFPQQLDDHFLVISDTLPGNVPWKYVDSEELKDMLCEKIDEGFCFPLNPKWILADKGWKKVYDKMAASPLESTQKSLDSWYPPESGVREKFETIHQRFPDGFERIGGEGCKKMKGRDAANLAKAELAKYMARKKKVKLKMRAAMRIAVRMQSLRSCSEAKSEIDENDEKETEGGECRCEEEAAIKTEEAEVSNTRTDTSSPDKVKPQDEDRDKSKEEKKEGDGSLAEISNVSRDRPTVTRSVSERAAFWGGSSMRKCTPSETNYKARSALQKSSGTSTRTTLWKATRDEENSPSGASLKPRPAFVRSGSASQKSRCWTDIKGARERKEDGDPGHGNERAGGERAHAPNGNSEGRRSSFVRNISVSNRVAMWEQFSSLNAEKNLQLKRRPRLQKDERRLDKKLIS